MNIPAAALPSPFPPASTAAAIGWCSTPASALLSPLPPASPFQGFLAKKGVFSGEARTVKVALFGSTGFLGVAFSKDPVRFPRRGESRLKQCWYKVCTLGRLLWKAKSVTVDRRQCAVAIWGRNSAISV